MNTKRIFSVLTAAVIAFVFSACGNGSVEFKDKTDDTKNQSTDIFFSSYSDAVSSFAELENTALFVVRGYVLNATQKSKYAQEAVIRVEDTYKGKTAEEITLYQNSGDNTVQKGSEYILFLNLQEPENPDSQIYYPVGGGIGALKIDSSVKTILTANDRIIDSDLRLWVNENISSRRSGGEYSISVKP